jgi:hypothetical protein
MEQLLSERMEKRRTLIKSAIKAAEARAIGRASLTEISSDDSTGGGLTPLSSATLGAFDARVSSGTVQGAVIPMDEGPGDAQSPGSTGGRGKGFLVAAAVAALAAGVGLFAGGVGRSAEPPAPAGQPATPAPVPEAPPATATPAPPPVPSADPAENVVDIDLGEEPETAASAGTPTKGGTRGRRPRAAAPAAPPPASPAAASAKPAATPAPPAAPKGEGKKPFISPFAEPDF